LQWADVSFERNRIEVRRAWVGSRIGEPKSKASKAPVPLSPILAEFMLGWKQATAYAHDRDWVFPSTKLKGQKPRAGSMLTKSYLRPAAVKAGVELKEGQRFGFHNLRHSLASFFGEHQDGRENGAITLAPRQLAHHAGHLHPRDGGHETGRSRGNAGCDLPAGAKHGG
jgi:integrase